METLVRLRCPTTAAVPPSKPARAPAAAPMPTTTGVLRRYLIVRIDAEAMEIAPAEAPDQVLPVLTISNQIEEQVHAKDGRDIKDRHHHEADEETGLHTVGEALRPPGRGEADRAPDEPAPAPRTSASRSPRRPPADAWPCSIRFSHAQHGAHREPEHRRADEAEDLPPIPEAGAQRPAGRKNLLPIGFQEIAADGVTVSARQQHSEHRIGPVHMLPFSGRRTPAQRRSAADLASCRARRPAASMA